MFPYTLKHFSCPSCLQLFYFILILNICLRIIHYLGTYVFLKGVLIHIGRLAGVSFSFICFVWLFWSLRLQASFRMIKSYSLRLSRPHIEYWSNCSWASVGHICKPMGNKKMSENRVISLFVLNNNTKLQLIINFLNFHIYFWLKGQIHVAKCFN